MEQKDIMDLMFIHKAEDGIYGFCDNACYLVSAHDQKPQYVRDVEFPYSRKDGGNYCIVEAGYVYYGKLTNVDTIFKISDDDIEKVIDVPESKSQYCLGRLSQNLLYVAYGHDLMIIIQRVMRDYKDVRLNGTFSIHNHQMQCYYYSDGKLY